MPSSVRAISPMRTAPAVWEEEGPTITGPRISKISIAIRSFIKGFLWGHCNTGNGKREEEQKEKAVKSLIKVQLTFAYQRELYFCMGFCVSFRPLGCGPDAVLARRI